MKNILNNHLQLMLLIGFLVIGTACNQAPANQEKEPVAAPLVLA